MAGKGKYGASTRIVRLVGFDQDEVTPLTPRLRELYRLQSAIPDFHLSDESKAVIKDILQSKCKEGDGVIEVDELGECLEAFGFTADDEDVAFLQKHFDSNGDGELEVKEIMDNIDVLNWHCFYGKELMKEFKKIDTDGDCFIRYPDMLRVLTTRGAQPLEPMEARKLLDHLARKFDANFDGKFCYSEFVKIYMSDLLPYKDNIGVEDELIAAALAEKKVPKKKKLVKKKSVTREGGAVGGAGAGAGAGAGSSRQGSAASAVGRSRNSVPRSHTKAGSKT